jgi:hypothetical protein
MRQKVRKSIEAISIGVSIFALTASSDAKGRQRRIPTTMAMGIAILFTVCFDSAILLLCHVF